MARATNASIAAGSSLNADVQLGGAEWLTVIGIVGNAGSAAGASGDVGVTVQPFLDDAFGGEPDQTGTLADVLVPAIDTGVAVLANSKAQQIVRFRVAGLRKVRILIKNNNAAAKPVEADFDLG